MKRIIIYLVLFIFLMACNNNSNKLSIAVLGGISNNSNEILSSNIDSFESVIEIFSPHVISFQSTQLSNNSKNYFIKNGYNVRELADSINELSIITFSSLIYKSNSFSLLTSSVYTLQNDSLEIGKNFIDWVKFKDLNSGYIFYIFKLKVQSELDSYRAHLISIETLNHINKLTGGSPVILIGDLNNNSEVKDYLTREWKGVYTLNNVCNSKHSKINFFLNEYFKLEQYNIREIYTYEVSNISISFTKNAGKVSRNKIGDTLPDFNN